MKFLKNWIRQKEEYYLKFNKVNILRLKRGSADEIRNYYIYKIAISFIGFDIYII